MFLAVLNVHAGRRDEKPAVTASPCLPPSHSKNFVSNVNLCSHEGICAVVHTWHNRGTVKTRPTFTPPRTWPMTARCGHRLFQKVTKVGCSCLILLSESGIQMVNVWSILRPSSSSHSSVHWSMHPLEDFFSGLWPPKPFYFLRFYHQRVSST